ncbi:hypothetical protein ACFYVL_34960 [Streptomyces sp. NPDC004111]|uniref:hypothetical protein n=1 Tax=Streptomyces sp. NPDC004111 TaxID=3364690 RepID=UPI0036827506
MLTTSRAALRDAGRACAAWAPSRWGVAGAAAVLCGLLLGLPTSLVPNPVFGRVLPPEWWNYPVLAASSVLGGLILATYLAPRDRTAPREPRGRLGVAGGVLSFLAVGCPVCNKLVLLALGTSGALTLWAPLQPVLALVSLVLLAVAAVRRLAGEVACPAAPAAAAPASTL